MRNFLRLFVLTLALAASALTLSPRDASAACVDGDTRITQGRCCTLGRIYLEWECVNGGWRVIESICTSQAC